MEVESLRGGTAIVLGASTPYGAATARMLAREGAAVVLGGRSRDKLEALEQEIQDSGGRALSLGVHLAKRHHLEHLVEAAVESFGGLDYLLFMARASAPPLESLDVDAFDRSVDVNVKGFLYALAAALPAMRDTGSGHVAYLGTEEPEGTDPLYSAARAAVEALLRELASGSRESEIRASEILLSATARTNPERCAEVACRALLAPYDEVQGCSVHRL